MLVFISDLHLTDGSSGTTVRADAFRILRNQLHILAYAASWRRDGTYRPIEELHLVLLGDILDVIRSQQWTTPGDAVKPWSDIGSPAFSKKIASITQAIVKQNKESLDVLKSLSVGHSVTLPRKPGPPGTSGLEAGQPRARRIQVQVRIHYQVGNHDWFYHLPSTAFNQIRAGIVDAMGLASDPNSPFPHDPRESAMLDTVYREHAVCARHGDVYDPLNCEHDRDGSSLGDAIVTELLNRFPAEVETQLQGQLPNDCVDGLKEIDNVRPLLLIPVWVDGLLRRTCSSPMQVKAVKKIWDDLADQFLAVPFVQKRDSPWNPFDDVDKLEYALKFSKGVSFQAIGRLAAWAQERTHGSEAPFSANALREQAFRSRTAKFIVYGHTHREEVVPLDLTFGGGKALQQFYLNAGTWRRVHELAQSTPSDQEFVGYDVMSYVLVYKDDERRGRPFETWTGSLGQG